jgi:hypothetical protein
MRPKPTISFHCWRHDAPEILVPAREGRWDQRAVLVIVQGQTRRHKRNGGRGREQRTRGRQEDGMRRAIRGQSEGKRRDLMWLESSSTMRLLTSSIISRITSMSYTSPARWGMRVVRAIIRSHPCKCPLHDRRREHGAEGCIRTVARHVTIVQQREDSTERSGEARSEREAHGRAHTSNAMLCYVMLCYAPMRSKACLRSLSQMNPSPSTSRSLNT